TGTSDQNGQVSNTLTLNGNAAGTVSVTVAVTSNPSVKTSFTITAIPVITVGGFIKVGGDNQTAVAGAQFAQPIVVQVNTNTGSPASGIPVSFSASGGAVLSATTVTTGANGQAQVTVTAPNTAGSITVTAAASGLTQTFNLKVAPPGPSFTANSFVNAADQKVNSLSPFSLATIVASGIAPGIQGTMLANTLGIGGPNNTL